MTDRAECPLLFLDVDGTLLPYGGARLPSALEEWDSWQDVSNPQLAKIDLAHGPRLPALPCALMWATAWMDDANQVIAPLLGLPELPLADLPDAPEADDADMLHWKTRALVRVAVLPTGELTGTLSTWGDASRSCQGWPASFSDVGSQVGTLSLAATRRHGMPAP
jgi:hypothetical protein